MKCSTGSSWNASWRSSRWKRRATAAPVPAHGLEADQLERLPAGADDQPGVALLAARRAAADLGHPEPRVDLLELELEPAPHAELARGAPRRRGRRWSRAGSRRARRRARVGLAGVDEEGVGVAVDDAVARLLDGGRREADHVLAGDGDRVGDGRREEAARPRRPSTPKSEFMRIFVAWAPTASPCRAGAARAPPRGGRPGRAGCPARRRGTRRRWACGRAAGRRLAGRDDVGQRVDVEGPDQARIEALEVEDEDVPVEARDASRGRGRPRSWSPRRPRCGPTARRARAPGARPDRASPPPRSGRRPGRSASR